MASRSMLEVAAEMDQKRSDRGAKVDVRATLKLRNDAMISSRERLGLTQIQVDDLAGVPKSTTAKFEMFSFGEINNFEIDKRAELVAGVLELRPDEILPQSLKRYNVKHTHERRFASEPSELVGENTRYNLPDPSAECGKGDLPQQVDRVLKTLSYREREILKLRFGIGDKDGYTYTLEEIGRIFGVCRERVKQVECRAIRKLQHPVRARKLEGFIEPEDRPRTIPIKKVINLNTIQPTT